MIESRPVLHAVFAGMLAATCACATDMDTDKDTPGADNPPAEHSEQAQVPPQGEKAVEAWLKTGAYKDWSCEPKVHESRLPSPHGFNRICSNDAISAHADDGSDWPKGAAGVKELYASADADKPIGYAVYIKTAADSGDGDNWYWYERTAQGVVADGPGTGDREKKTCVGCHSATGSDDGHTPTAGGRDQVYTPVP
jgi:hypothetical protein